MFANVFSLKYFLKWNKILSWFCYTRLFTECFFQQNMDSPRMLWKIFIMIYTFLKNNTWIKYFLTLYKFGYLGYKSDSWKRHNIRDFEESNFQNFVWIPRKKKLTCIETLIYNKLWSKGYITLVMINKIPWTRLGIYHVWNLVYF